MVRTHYLELVVNMETVSMDVVRNLLLTGKTYSEISTELQRMYPHIVRGLSIRSVRRYVKGKALKEICDRDRRHTIEGSLNEVSFGQWYQYCLMLILFSA